MMELVTAHSQIEDPMKAAIWIRQQDREAWLLEVLPDMPHDEHPERPVAFNARRTWLHEQQGVAPMWQKACEQNCGRTLTSAATRPRAKLYALLTRMT